MASILDLLGLQLSYLSLINTGETKTEEDPFRHKWKCVEWNVKNQIKQTNKSLFYQHILYLLFLKYDCSKLYIFNPRVKIIRICAWMILIHVIKN